MAKKGKKKYYSLLEGNKEVAVFTGTAPRNAALKAARRGYTDIRLREHGRKKDGMWRIHVFKGSRKKVKKPENAPSWMPDEIWEANVKKVKVEKVKK
ncbi:MAG: non-histone chromosomal MC1 family protein [Candidatus Altiarchaeota archaeon]